MRVAILVPLRTGVPDRDRLWRFTSARWAADHPDWPIVEGRHEAHEGPFNRSQAINRAASVGDWDVALIIDADVLVDPHLVRSTVDVAAGTDGLVIAATERWMLSKAGTDRILDGYDGPWDGLARQRYGTREDPRGAQVSCCIAVSRKLWEDVGGFDELFVGYGWEDVAFRNACESVSGKATVWLAPHPIWHLHHEPSPEDDERADSLKRRNEARARRYIAAHGDREATQALIDEHRAARREGSAVEVVADASRIPRILHRTVPADTSAEVEAWWARFADLHPGWELRTWREPLNPAEFPLTADLWPRCANGAQKAGLVRLELLVSHGGVYVDSDVAPFRSFEPLLDLQAFAGWEDQAVVPDFLLGARPHHPAFELALAKARRAIEGGGDAWQSGPGVTTEVLPGRDDVLLLPPGAFAPFHYLERSRAAEVNADPPAYSFCAHQWHGSWLTAEQRASIERRQRDVR